MIEDINKTTNAYIFLHTIQKWIQLNNSGLLLSIKVRPNQPMESKVCVQEQLNHIVKSFISPCQYNSTLLNTLKKKSFRKLLRQSHYYLNKMLYSVNFKKCSCLIGWMFRWIQKMYDLKVEVLSYHSATSTRILVSNRTDSWPILFTLDQSFQYFYFHDNNANNIYRQLHLHALGNICITSPIICGSSLHE